MSTETRLDVLSKLRSAKNELDALEKWCLEHCNWRSLNWREVTNR